MARRSVVLVLLFFVGWSDKGWAQTSTESGAQATALGNAGTALAYEATGYANPASWATFTGRVVSFFASEAFGLAALRLGGVAYLEPTRLGTFALGVRAFGFEDYRDVHLQGGFARGFRLGTTRRFLLGLGLRHQRVTIPGYGHAGAMALSIGAIVALGPTLSLGFQAANIHGPTRAGEALPRHLAVGLAYTPTEQVLVVLDASKDVRFPLSVRGGIEIQPVEVLALRAGAATEPARLTAGVGLRLGMLRADFAGERHEVLGWSPAVAFGLRW